MMVADKMLVALNEELWANIMYFVNGCRQDCWLYPVRHIHTSLIGQNYMHIIWLLSITQTFISGLKNLPNAILAHYYPIWCLSTV